MKKICLWILNVSLCLFVALGFTAVSVSAKDTKQISQNQMIHLNDSNESVQFYKYSAEEYKDVIRNDSNIPQNQKVKMINEVDSLERRKDGGGWDYWTIYDVCKVTSSYTCRPYFYAYAEFASGGYPHEIQKVLYANIDRNDDGVSKQFSGSLFYHLEKYNKLHWDLNGDFYNNGTTNVGGSVEIGVGEKTSVGFSVSYSKNHYAYCHKSGDVTF